MNQQFETAIREKIYSSSLLTTLIINDNTKFTNKVLDDLIDCNNIKPKSLYKRKIDKLIILSTFVNTESEDF